MAFFLLFAIMRTFVDTFFFFFRSANGRMKNVILHRRPWTVRSHGRFVSNRRVKVNKSCMTFTRLVCIMRAYVLRVLDAAVDCRPRGDRSIAVNFFKLCRIRISIVRSILSYFVRWIPNWGEELSELSIGGEVWYCSDIISLSAFLSCVDYNNRWNIFKVLDIFTNNFNLILYSENLNLIMNICRIYRDVKYDNNNIYFRKKSGKSCINFSIICL